MSLPRPSAIHCDGAERRKAGRVTLACPSSARNPKLLCNAGKEPVRPTAKSPGQVVPCHPRGSSWPRSRPRPGDAGSPSSIAWTYPSPRPSASRNFTATAGARTAARSPRADILKLLSDWWSARDDSSQRKHSTCAPVPSGTAWCHIASFGRSASADNTTFLTSGNGSLLPISIHFTTVGSSANPDLAM